MFVQPKKELPRLLEIPEAELTATSDYAPVEIEQDFGII